MNTTTQLTNNIMRRIYYAYSIRMATHPFTVRFVLLLLATLALARLVHVAMVWQSFSNVRIGDLGTYMKGMILNADLPTLVVVGVIIYLLLSLPRSTRVTKTHSAPVRFV